MFQKEIKKKNELDIRCYFGINSYLGVMIVLSLCRKVFLFL